jgi:ketosteroid isomerase-like protein
VTLPRLSAVLAGVVLAARAAIGLAASGAEETVLALEAERGRAMVAGDLAALDRIFADDAIYTHSNGRSETKREFIDAIRSGGRRYVRMTGRDLRLRRADGAVVVTGRADGEVVAGGATIPLALVYTAVYAESGGRWRLLAYESTKSPEGESESGRKEAAVPHAATGAFDVKMTPLKAEDGSTLARFALDKQYHGALDGRSRGEMISAGTAVKNSAGYVAFETFTGTLDGRAGGFVLQHSATMTRGDGKLSITVVPDSGTGALEGISGTMTIRIENGAHFYDFAYALP